MKKKSPSSSMEKKEKISGKTTSSIIGKFDAVDKTTPLKIDPRAIGEAVTSKKQGNLAVFVQKCELVIPLEAARSIPDILKESELFDRDCEVAVKVKQAKKAADLYITFYKRKRTDALFGFPPVDIDTSDVESNPADMAHHAAAIACVCISFVEAMKNIKYKYRMRIRHLYGPSPRMRFEVILQGEAAIVAAMGATTDANKRFSELKMGLWDAVKGAAKRCTNSELESTRFTSAGGSSVYSMSPISKEGFIIQHSRGCVPFGKNRSEFACGSRVLKQTTLPFEVSYADSKLLRQTVEQMNLASKTRAGVMGLIEKTQVKSNETSKESFGFALESLRDELAVHKQHLEKSSQDVMAEVSIVLDSSSSSSPMMELHCVNYNSKSIKWDVVKALIGAPKGSLALAIAMASILNVQVLVDGSVLVSPREGKNKRITTTKVKEIPIQSCFYIGEQQQEDSEIEDKESIKMRGRPVGLCNMVSLECC